LGLGSVGAVVSASLLGHVHLPRMRRAPAVPGPSDSTSQSITMVRDNWPVGKSNRRTLHLGPDGRWPLAAVRAVPAFGADREPADALNAVRGHGEDVSALECHVVAAGAVVGLELADLEGGDLVERLAAHDAIISRLALAWCSLSSFSSSRPSTSDTRYRGRPDMSLPRGVMCPRSAHLRTRSALSGAARRVRTSAAWTAVMSWSAIAASIASRWASTSRGWASQSRHRTCAAPGRAYR